MTRFTLLIFLLILSVTNIIAQDIPLSQDKYEDSLQTVLRKATTDSMRARANFLLSDFWSYTDTARSAKYLEDARRVSGKHPYLLALHQYYLASLLFETDIHASEKAFMQADTLLSRFTFKESWYFRSKAWRNYGVLQQKQDNEREFMRVLTDKAIPFAQKAGDSSLTGFHYGDVGLILMNNVQYDRAMPYFIAAINLLKNDPSRVPTLLFTYINAAESYVHMQKYPEAKAMLDDAKMLLAPYPASDLWLVYYKAEGQYFNKQKQYDQAQISYDKGITLATTLKKDLDKQNLQFSKYKTWTLQKKYTNALEILQIISKQKETMYRADNRMRIFYGLAETYASLGEMGTAYKWLQTFTTLADSVYDENLKRDISEIEVKYKKAENEKKIAVLKAENEKAILSDANNRLIKWLFIATSIILLIILLFIWLYYKKSRKLAQQEMQVQLSHAMLQGGEQERVRIARDLHDGLGGMLAGIKLNLAGLTADNFGQRNKIIGQLDSSAAELRRIARNMMPEALLSLGLETAVRDMCDALSTASCEIIFQAYDIQPNIPMQKQITIFRILQELLANALRHAHASKVMLQCSQNNDTFYITVEDNGKGYDTNALPVSKGIGLGNIKNRVEYLQGKIDINSVINAGTDIHIELNVAG